MATLVFAFDRVSMAHGRDDRRFSKGNQEIVELRSNLSRRLGPKIDPRLKYGRGIAYKVEIRNPCTKCRAKHSRNRSVGPPIQ